MRGFVVEEGEEEDEMHRKKHKKKHRHEHTESEAPEGDASGQHEKHAKEHDSADEDLEDEDFDLLRENLGYEVRPVHTARHYCTSDYTVKQNLRNKVSQNS